jgi:hypothetical protein
MKFQAVRELFGGGPEKHQRKCEGLTQASGWDRSVCENGCCASLTRLCGTSGEDVKSPGRDQGSGGCDP